MQPADLILPRPSRYRRHWLLKPGTVYLNHGSFGACPKPILEQQTQLRARMEAEPVQFLWRRYEEGLDPARASLAKFIGARPRDLVFVGNATAGINSVVRSLKLRSGEEVLTTNLDYNACRNALAAAAGGARAKLVVAQVPFPVRDEEEVLASILQSVTRRTRFALIDHVTSHTALIYPIERIIRELEARGVDCLVDGAHAPGMVPIDVSKLQPAYYTGNLHKWVCAPKGAGFLWAREDKQAGLQPAVVSHGYNTPRAGYNRFQDLFDWAGTFDSSAWFCVGEALRWMGRLLPGGWQELRRRNHALALRAREVLCRELEVEPACPERMLGSMASVPLPGRFQGKPRVGRIDVEQLRLYDEFRIEVPLMRIGPKQKRHFRISAQIYNTIDEYRYLAEALKRLAS